MALLVASCGYKEGVIQPSPKSYLWFTGNIENADVYIDDSNLFKLDQYVKDPASGENRAPSRSVHYQLAPGKHTVVIKKENKIVVNRVLILGEGMTTEIEIP